jgi:pilus assembly protein CpaB
MAGESRGGMRVLIFAGIGVVAAVALVMLLVRTVSEYQAAIEEARRPEETVTAVVASRDLTQGVTITEEDLFVIPIQVNYLHPEVYHSPEHVIGRIPRERILANEFIREERLADADDGIGLNAIIPRGQRAISINVANGASLSGLLQPKNTVDVLATLRGDDNNDIRETKTLVQAVYVLAVNNKLSSNPTPEEEEPQRDSQARRMAPSVTLAVTPEQAEQIAHAAAKGDITLTLRNDIDVSFVEVSGADATAVLGGPDPAPAPVARPRPAAAPAPAPQGPTLTIIRGTKAETVDVGQTKLPNTPAPR